MSDYKRARWAEMVEEAVEDLAGTCPLVEDETIIWAHARITTLESTLQTTRWHVSGIFGESHPVVIAIDKALSEGPGKGAENE